MTARTDSVDTTGWEYEAVPTDKGIIHIVSGGLARDQGDVTVARNRYSWLDPSPLSSILVHGDPDS
jgi:hypothetical protein